MHTHNRRFGRLGLVVLLLMGVLAIPTSSAASTGTAELVGTIRFAEEVPLANPEPMSAGGGFQGLVTTDTFQGLVNCSFSASVVESVVQGHGTGTLNCASGGNSASCGVAYTHVGTTVTGNMSCSGQIMPPSPIIVCVVVYVPPNAYFVCVIVSL